jgi:hypothetical protein
LLVNLADSTANPIKAYSRFGPISRDPRLGKWAFYDSRKLLPDKQFASRTLFLGPAEGMLITSDILLVTSSNYTYVSDIVLIRDCDHRIPAPEWGFNVQALSVARPGRDQKKRRKPWETP